MRPFLLAPAAALLLAAAPARAEVKLGFVDFQKALNEVEEGKAATASLRNMAAEKQKVLEADQNELRRLDAEYQKQQGVLSDEARRDKERELQQRALEAQNRYMGFQKEMMEKERELTGGIRAKMAKIAEEIATSEGLTLMFERSEAGIIHGPEKLDFTTQLIRLYDQRHKPDAAAPKKKPAKDDKKAK
jgi:outer membrane protein